MLGAPQVGAGEQEGVVHPVMGPGTQAQLDQLSWFAGVSPGFSTEGLCPREPLGPGQRWMVGHPLPRPEPCPALPWPADIVNKDAKSTLRVLYSLFRKHKLKESADGVPLESPN